MVVLLTYGLCPRKKPVSHLTSAVRLACSTKFCTEVWGVEILGYVERMLATYLLVWTVSYFFTCLSESSHFAAPTCIFLSSRILSMLCKLSL